MSLLDYWHPVSRSRDLRPDCATGIKLAGQSIALFRTGDGSLGAVEDMCVHRRMKLSLGKVRDRRLVCPYHGWSFTREGQGKSPSTPHMYACVKSYECTEVHGAIWLKGAGSTQKVPDLTMPAWKPVGVVFNKIKAPLELVIDNFSEVEHTVATHPHFGFDPDQASQAVVQIDSDEDSVTVRNQGPAKMPPLVTRLLAWVWPGDHFHSNYTFRFDPPRSSVTHFWTDPGTGCERMAKYHLFHYFVPEDEKNTQIVTFGFLSSKWPLFPQLGKHLGWFVRQKIASTVGEDAQILENLADDSTHMEGMKLSRFDRVLGMTRVRTRRIYYGETQTENPCTATIALQET